MGKWKDIGDKAVEIKVIQALRERVGMEKSYTSVDGMSFHKG